MATDSSVLAWRISWTEEPGGLQSVESQRVTHAVASKQQQYVYMKVPRQSQRAFTSLEGELETNQLFTYPPRVICKW